VLTRRKEKISPVPEGLEFFLLIPTGYAIDCEVLLLAMTVSAGA